jgi:hypothetical protein
MSNRIVALSAAAAFAAYAAVSAVLVAAAPALAGEASPAIVLSSTVDHPLSPVTPSAAAAAATQSPGSVGAMHYATDGVATSVADVQRQGGKATAGAVRWLASAELTGS